MNATAVSLPAVANTKRSTGPRTSEGRAVSSLNSRRHGLSSSRHSVLPHESSEEFDALLDDLRSDLMPVGAVEELLVRKLAEAEWRTRRAAGFEVSALVQEGADERGAGLAVWRDSQQSKGRVLEVVVRYGNSAERSYYAALHELQRRQAARLGAQVALPVALDVTVNAEGIVGEQ